MAFNIPSFGFGGASLRTPDLDANNPVANSSLKPRSFDRSSRVQGDVNSMGRSSRGGGASSSVMRVANAQVDTFAFNYHTGKPKIAIVKTPPPKNADGSRTLDLTMTVNVSGHDQSRDATSVDRYAKSNTYAVRVVYPNGKSETIRNIPRNDPSKAEYATAIDLSLDLQEGKTIIEAWPEHSAGVGGYVEGRRYEMFFNEDPGKAMQEDGDRQPFRE